MILYGDTLWLHPATFDNISVPTKTGQVHWQVSQIVPTLIILFHQFFIGDG